MALSREANPPNKLKKNPHISFFFGYVDVLSKIVQVIRDSTGLVCTVTIGGLCAGRVTDLSLWPLFFFRSGQIWF